MYNGSDAVSSHDSPNEESDTGRRDEISLEREKMTDFVHGEPDGWQTAKPEDEETGEVHSICSRAFGEAVRDILIGGPDRSDHQSHAFTWTDCKYSG